MVVLVRLISSLWCGALWAVGLLVAPLLFAVLGRAQAVSVAGPLFRWLALAGLTAAVLLLVFDQVARGLALRPAGRRMVLLMAVGTGLGQFGVQSVMQYGNSLLAAGQSVPAWAGFGLWHGVATAIYFLVAVLGLRLVAVVR